MRSELKRDLVYLILQFFEEENYKESIHELERELGCFLNINHLKELVLNGQWEEVERYLSAFTKVGDNSNSTKIFFEIRKQKYLEALDSREMGKAVNILSEELKVFAATWEDEYKELIDLLTKNNFRECAQFACYTTARTERMVLMAQLKILFEANPLLHDKLRFPVFNNSRLLKLLLQSWNWQHVVCRNTHPCPKPTFLNDHDCRRILRAEELEGLNLIDEEDNSAVGWRLTEFNGPLQCQSLVLPSSVLIDKIATLVYTNCAQGILLLAENGIHQVWKWPSTQSNPDGKATTKNAPKVWVPESGRRMINDLTNANLLDRTSCFALAKTGYLLSASGGPVSLFNMMSFGKVIDIMKPLPVATALAFYPRDHNIFAIGMDDSTIRIYDIRSGKATVKIVGHFARITGLAFSEALNLLVSTGADSQIISWESCYWIRQRSVFMQIRADQTRWVRALPNAQVHFHLDERHFLALDETQLAIYEAANLACVKQWMVPDFGAPISQAVFSCDCVLIYACFLDGVINIFCSASLIPQCRIKPTAYIPRSVSTQNVEPTAIAANPKEENQFAVGMSDGRIFVFEPPESNGKWGVQPPVHDHASTSIVCAAPLVIGSSSSAQPWLV